MTFWVRRYHDNPRLIRLGLAPWSSIPLSIIAEAFREAFRSPTVHMSIIQVQQEVQR